MKSVKANDRPDDVEGTAPDGEPEVLTVEQAAELLQLSQQTLTRLTKSGMVPGRRVGNQWRFHRPTLIEWVKGKD